MHEPRWHAVCGSKVFVMLPRLLGLLTLLPTYSHPTDTQEGLETCFAVSYYSRLRLVSNLLPLLQRAPNPHVLSILNGTKETKINEDDVNLEQKWAIRSVINHTTLLTSLAFDHLAAQDARKHIVFLHATYVYECPISA